MACTPRIYFQSCGGIHPSFPVCLGVDTWRVVVGGIHPKSKLSEWAGHQHSPEEHLGPFNFYCWSSLIPKITRDGYLVLWTEAGVQQPFCKGVFMQVCWMNVQVSNSTFDLEMSKLCFYLDLLVPIECWTMCIFCTRQSAERVSLHAHWQRFSVNEF